MTRACASCAFDNPDDARFCGNCGNELSLVCGACGHANPGGFKFCNSCGTALDDGAPAVAAAPAPAATTWPMVEDVGPERRHLTVLFCDLVGSSALSQSLDPEDLRTVMRGYEDACGAAIERLGGYVAQFYGDGVLAYFGYPVAHEDAAERAVHAALAMVEAAGAVPAPTPLQVRIGIHSGMVVVGMEKTGVPGKSNSAVGETPNIAARMQALAEPGSVMISAATAALVGQAFTCEDEGVRSLRGIGEPVGVFRVVGERRGGGDGGDGGARLTRHIGRERELEAIIERWRSARDGEGQVVLLSGEAGIGKSRLVQELRERLGGEPVTLMRHHCSPFHGMTPLHPLARAIETALNLDLDDKVDARLAKLGEWIERRGLDRDEALPLLADLLRIPPCEDCPAPSLSPQDLKDGTLEVLLKALANAAAEGPVLFLVANAQWADPTTLDFLAMAIDQIATLPVLLVITHRPEFRIPWPARSHMLPLTLTRLNAADSRRMVADMAGGAALPEDVLATIVTRADGVPMFLHELTATMLASDYLTKTESGWALTGPLPPMAVPLSLQDSLMARLDRLGPYKEVAQFGAMLGRGFRYRVLLAVTGIDETLLREALAELVRQELLLQRGLPPDASYLFRQALVQEVAYETLLRSRRQEMHQRIAEVIEAQFPEIAESEPEEVARHLAGAGLGERALAYRIRAARQALRSSAMAEALEQLDEALALLGESAEGEETQRQEMEVQAMRGLALAATRGYAVPAVGEAYERALVLSEALGDESMQMRALLGLYGHSLNTGNGNRGQQVTQRLLRLAEERGGDQLELAALLINAGRLSEAGELAPAAQSFEAAIAKLDAAAPDEALWQVTQDPGVVAWSMLARNRFILGFADGARQALKSARQRADSVRHAFSLGFALSVGATVLASMRDWEAAERTGAEALALAERHGFPSWQAQAAIFKGLATIKLGRAREGEAEIERGLAVGERIWSGGPAIFFRIALAEAALELGHVDEAESIVETGLAQIEDRGGGAHAAELHRLRGSILRHRGDTAAAIAAFERAMAVAAAQGALSWELRAALELAEIHCETGNHGKAQALLAPILGRLKEGFDTADAVRARTLLETVPA